MATRKAPSNVWKPGQSGNPAGRPAGAGKVAKLREAIAADVPAILQAVIEQAKGGDMQAARILIERVIPAMKPQELAAPLSLPVDGTLTEQGKAVLGAVAAGELAPGQASQLLGAVATLARVTELDELVARITALENAQHGKP